MKTTSLLGATLAAILPAALLLPACSVGGDADEQLGVSPEEIVEEDDCEPGEARWCEQTEDTSRDGEQACVEDEDGFTGWTACAPREMDGPEDCYPDEQWDGERCAVQQSGSTPIVLSFENRSVRYTTGGGDFDLTGADFNVSTDWPTAATPWLALDRDGSGTIDSGAELFGSATRLASGDFARHGFEALAELDDDGDGALTARDAAFAHLTIWSDANADRVSQPSELRPLAEAGVTALSLQMTVEPRCDARNNCERERSAFTYVDATGTTHVGTAIDVHLAWR
jgi:hypothetical protein